MSSHGREEDQGRGDFCTLEEEQQQHPAGGGNTAAPALSLTPAHQESFPSGGGFSHGVSSSLTLCPGFLASSAHKQADDDDV